jgi:hypothetical protein
MWKESGLKIADNFLNKTNHMRKKLILSGLACALSEAAYVTLIALFMTHANQYFGPGPNVLGVVAFLLVFVFSAAISGALVLGKPILLYLENQKREALELFAITLGWIFFMLVILFVFLIF